MSPLRSDTRSLVRLKRIIAQRSPDSALRALILAEPDTISIQRLLAISSTWLRLLDLELDSELTDTAPSTPAVTRRSPGGTRAKARGGARPDRLHDARFRHGNQRRETSPGPNGRDRFVRT